MNKKTRIDGLLDLLSSVPEGKMLVDLAMRQQVSIFFDPDLAKEYDYRFLAGGYTRGFYVTESNSVALCERLNDYQLLRTLTHELAHMHQFQHIPVELEDNFTARDYMIFSRLLEGEADARAARVIQAINRAYGSDILPNCRGGFRPFNWLAGKFSGAVAVAERSFRKFQGSADAHAYDREAVAAASKVKKTQSLSAAFNNASIAGLFKNGDTLYLGAKTMPELIEKVSAYLPRDMRYPGAQP